ncbi:metal ABC transporter permease [Streptomyces sp. NPDC088801]|uniref:metal ABC transporter permease n=1 Tax=Streptomyces sp. NPDC088801 TaxID=3365903 RepID=UPI0038102B38
MTACDEKPRCWLVLIGWSLMGDAVSHAVLPGVVPAYVLGVPFALGAIVFTTLFALGLVLISITPARRTSTTSSSAACSASTAPT